MRILRSLLLAGLVGLGLSAGKAQAVPIPHDHGVTRTFLIPLPDNCPIRKGEQKPEKLGYRYWRLRIFWLPVWTANGEFVVYRGPESRPLDEKAIGQDANLVALVTGLPVEQVRTPLCYNCPVGWLVLAGVVLLVGFGAMLGTGKKPVATTPLVQGETTDVNALLADERYQQALQVIHENAPQTEPNREDIERGLDWLTRQGIPREEAQANLAVLLEAVHR